MTKAGLPGIGLHSLRHGHASQLLSQGVPIPTVSKRLGHANPSITLRLYSHALESDELAAAKRWDDAFADVVNAAHTDRMVLTTNNRSVARADLAGAIPKIP
jgi:site-specific recombinase XerD